MAGRDTRIFKTMTDNYAVFIIIIIIIGITTTAAANTTTTTTIIKSKLCL